MRLFLIIFVLVLALSCKKEPEIIARSNNEDFSEIFNSFWSKVNQYYVFWDIEKTKWDEIYYTYSPKFTQLNINDANDVKASVALFREISKELIDGHFLIQFNNNLIKDSIINPVQIKKRLTSQFYTQRDYLFADTNYLDNGFLHRADNDFSINGVPLLVTCGKIKDSILYFSCNQFKLKKSYFSLSTKSIRSVVDFFFNNVNTSFTTFNKVIIDVRGNLGGDILDLAFLFERLFEGNQQYGSVQYKIGPNRFDFSSWLPVYISGIRAKSLQPLKVVILADKNSASLSEIAIQLVKSRKENLFVGDTTYGASGATFDQQFFNSGSFVVSNFMSVELSATRFKSLQGHLFEGVGIVPDFNITVSNQQLALKKDLVLEKAISLLK
ncbi:MAG: hypothetical protein IKD55_11845 [Sediminibacterium sp.]|nr:hypothetical protein [Sediminibacterium sp.]